MSVIPVGSTVWLLTKAQASVNLSGDTRQWLLYTPNRCDTIMLVTMMCFKETVH